MCLFSGRAPSHTSPTRSSTPLHTFTAVKSPKRRTGAPPCMLQLKRKSSTSASLTSYSLPSARTLPLFLASFIEPAATWFVFGFVFVFVFVFGRFGCVFVFVFVFGLGSEVRGS
jgi:hypothetical protein